MNHLFSQKQSKTLKHIKNCLFIFGIVLLGGACTNSSDGTGKALINIRLIDGPGGFDEVFVEIEGVEVLKGKDRQGLDAEWIFIPYDQGNQQVDVSKLVGDGILLLGRTELSVGVISKIRLVLGKDHYLTKNGKRYSLTNRSPDAPITEIATDYRLDRNFSYDIYLDFDLARSIKATSDTTQFLLDPKIRSFALDDRTEIKGKIQPLTAKPIIQAIQGEDTITTLTDGQGNYALRGLEEGEYELHILPRSPFIDTVFSASTKAGEPTIIESILVKLPPVKK